MEQTRKHFKITSIIVLIFAAASLINIMSEIWFGEFNSVEMGNSDILLITKIVLVSVSLVMLMPQVYIGIKGLLIAKNPGTSKGHIVWATILLVFSIVSLIDPIAGMINNESNYDNMITIFAVVVEVSVYLDYIKYAKAVLNNAE